MNQHQGTRPLYTNSKTAPLGDAFISSNGPIQTARSTRPLRMSPEMMREALPNRIAEVQSELDYVEHLVNLFRPRINIFRYAETLLTLPDDAVDPNEEVLEEDLAPEAEEVPGDAEDSNEELATEAIEENQNIEDIDVSEHSENDEYAEEPEEEEVPPPPKLSYKERTLANFHLTPDKEQFAVRVSERIQAHPKLRQRVQITLHQFSDAESTYAKARGVFMTIMHNLPENAWELLEGIGIERLKGKAYAICGFYDNFRDDPMLIQVFPAPHQNPTMPVQPVQPVNPQPTPQKPQGLLSNLKGLFGKKA